MGLFVSVVQSKYEKRDLQQGGVQQPAFQRPQKILSNVPCGLHERMAQNSPIEQGTAYKGQGSEHSERISESRQADSTALRRLPNDRESGETPRGLQQTIGSTVDVSPVPRGTSQCAPHSLLLAVYVFIETSPHTYEAHFTSRRDADVADVFAGARTMVDWFHSQGAVVTAEIVERNRPLRAFVEALGFTLQNNACQTPNVSSKLTTVKYLSRMGLTHQPLRPPDSVD